MRLTVACLVVSAGFIVAAILSGFAIFSAMLLEYIPYGQPPLFLFLLTGGSGAFTLLAVIASLFGK